MLLNKIKPGRSNREGEAANAHVRFASSPALWASGLLVIGKNMKKIEFFPVLEAEWPFGCCRDVSHCKMLQT